MHLNKDKESKIAIVEVKMVWFYRVQVLSMRYLSVESHQSYHLCYDLASFPSH